MKLMISSSFYMNFYASFLKSVEFLFYIMCNRLDNTIKLSLLYFCKLAERINSGIWEVKAVTKTCKN